MKSAVLFFIAGVLLLMFSSCKEKSVDVETAEETPVEEVEPGSRNYTWDVTELECKTGATVSLFEIWGSSAYDIWAVGNASSPTYSVYHFDGSNWEYGIKPDGDGFSSIWGSSSDNIWIGSAGGLLYKYNGSEWSLYTQLKLPEYDEYCVQHLWGASADEIYAAGAKINGDDPTEETGIFKYDGSTWSRITMPKVYKNCYKSYKDANGDLLFICMDFGNGNTTLYSWTGTELKTLFFSSNSRLDVCRIGEKIIIVYSNKIYDYNGGDIKLLNDFSSVTGTLSIACGRSEKDIFLILLDDSSVNSVYHYNGTDAVEAYKLNLGEYPMMGCIFEKDVYILICDYYTGKTKILHGKLNE